ncbi:MAG: holo-ACP synthase [Vicinamibacterales bacterium]
MILGAGIDLIEIGRFEREAGRRGDALLATLFSPTELAECRAGRRPFACYAAGFAVKEAFFKAIGTGWAEGTTWRDVEVLAIRRRPSITVGGAAARVARQLGIERAHVSVTVAGGLAAASVVLEGER